VDFLQYLQREKLFKGKNWIWLYLWRSAWRSSSWWRPALDPAAKTGQWCHQGSHQCTSVALQYSVVIRAHISVRVQVLFCSTLLSSRLTSVYRCCPLVQCCHQVSCQCAGVVLHYSGTARAPINVILWYSDVIRGTTSMYRCYPAVSGITRAQINVQMLSCILGHTGTKFWRSTCRYFLIRSSGFTA
jgi:hypothetical protein